MPKISVIIPAYNSSDFIERTINSVLRQTFSDWELLVINDCSTDNTAEKIKSFCQKDPRIKYLETEKNSGGSATPKNIGIKNAQGEYVAFLDHDDEWLPEKLEKQLAVFENSNIPNLGIVFCGAKLIDENKKNFAVVNYKNKKSVFPDMLIRNPIFSNSSVLLKKEIINIIGERDAKIKYSEDYDMWLRIAKEGYAFFCVEEPLFKYYFHKNNFTKYVNLAEKVDNMEYIFDKNKDVYIKYKYLHIGYFRLGVMYFLAGSPQKSRNNFLNSIKAKKTFFPSYVGYIISFTGWIGVKIINLLIFFYRIIKGKKYF